MRSSHTITIFSDRPDLTQRSSSFVVSILVHIAALVLLTAGFIYNPEINDRIITQRYSVRKLDLHPVEPQLRHAAGSGISYPGPHPVAPTPSSAEKPAARPAVLRRVAQGKPGPQTLVQPNIPTTVTLKQEVPVPTVMIWTPEKTLAKAIVAPLPELPTASDLQPSFDPPNEEVNLADVEISATGLASKAQPIFAGTTSPVVVHGPESAQMPPATVSNSSAQPTPAAVLSISDLRMTEGTVTLPPVNETASSTSPGALAPGHSVKTSHSGNDDPASGEAGTSSATGAGNPAIKTSPTSVAGARSQAKALPAQRAAEGAGSGDQYSTEQITLPHDGQFGAVVVGASLEEQFPEMTGLWTGRLAYTVYLHVGLAKSWILQYSVPSSVEAAAGGNISRLEAPWPYNIVRPNIAPGDINADALMIRGFVNQEGRFETLSIVFPPEFPQARFVLDALQQWQFRPAKQNGQVTKVEVMLIIPE